MDRVTDNLIKEYCEEFDLVRVGIDKDFEKFVSYSIVSKEYPETFDIDDVWIGKSPSIDGIAVIVNGRLVDDVDEIEDLVKTNNILEAKFIFIQAKTTSSFDGSEIHNFGFGVKDCFSSSPSLSHNENVKKKITLIGKIYEKSGVMLRGLPECRLFFVTTGNWIGDSNLLARADAIKSDLDGLQQFSKVLVNLYGAKEIQACYFESKRDLSVEVTFNNKVLMSQTMNGISEAYIGLLPYSEFSKLIIDDADNIRPVFSDNVRAFQGENEVNKGIQKTIQSEQAELFAVLNNGVTVVAKNITVAGNRVTLRNYQVVNGCQTSHIIYNNRKESRIQSVWVPIKLIVTNTERITNEIIKATNNQTIVKAEELAALAQFQKDLEEYYKTFSGEAKLYYERRSKQYSNDPSVSNKNRIITIPIQIKVFAAMFLDSPHKVGRYYGTIAREIGAGIFHPEHKHLPYYTSALAFYQLESLFRNGQLDSKYKKCRFHLLFAINGIICGFGVVHLNSKQIEDNCEAILKILNDRAKCKELFVKVCGVLDSLKLDYDNRDNFKIQVTTINLKKAILEIKK